MSTTTTVSNHARVGEGLKIVQQALAPYVVQELRALFGKEWWARAYYNLPEMTQGKLPKQNGGEEDLKEQVDAAGLLFLVDRLWGDVFGKKLPKVTRSHAIEVRDCRNTWAHATAADFTAEDGYRALDTMARFVETFDKPASKHVKDLARAVQQQALMAAPKVVAAAEVLDATRAHGRAPLHDPVPAAKPAASAQPAAPAKQSPLGIVLKPWREVVLPHTDVAAGRYLTAEFAADLADVLAGKAEADYQDPTQFFARTFLTEGMRRLLASALQRVAGAGGDPVIQLKTAFGGGKTHTMLALYHVLRAGAQQAAPLPGVEPVLREAGVDPARMPKARVAVLVGTDLDASRERMDAAGNGVVVRTLWGELAAQLGGKPAYELVKSSDLAGVAPGAGTLVDLFGKFGPTVVLIDEFVAYARNIAGKTDLPAGSFDSNMTFIQALTEAAKRSRNGMVIASIPESDRELGGEVGKDAQERLEQIFGRVETVWKPVAAQEGFEIVRRRLFGEVVDPEARDLTCRQFHKLYGDTSGDFPKQAGEVGYLERLRAAYPIHPDVFDRLYEDWATLEEFQRTRGVLRLMAAVIHALWREGDQSPLIMPGSMPLHDQKVRWELTRYLPDTWNTVVDKDVDGEQSGPEEVDRSQKRFGQLGAARRLARTIFLGSAPHVVQQRTRGVEAPRIRLGVVQPHQSVPTYNDALHQLADRLTYLYSGEGRYWYDTRPNLNRTADDRAATMEAYKVVDEIKRRLAGQKGRADFASVHTFAESGDVPDVAEARLVILRPEATHRRTQQESPALRKVAEILESRGGSPRLHKNMLVFAAADEEQGKALDQITRRYLAWQSIERDAELLNLDRHGERQAKAQGEKDHRTVDDRLNEAYSWLIAPTQGTDSKWSWEAIRIPGSSPVVDRVTGKLRQNEALIPKWSGFGLKIELDRWFWKEGDHVELRKLWDAFANYGYLPRLGSEKVLLEAIADGLKHPDLFAYAQGRDDEGRYLGLIYNTPALVSALAIDSYSLLVKPEVARRQIEADEERQRQRLYEEEERRRRREMRDGEGETERRADGQTDVASQETRPAPKLRRYYGSVELNEKRINRDAQQIADEIVRHLSGLPRAKVKVTLEIEAEAPDGVPDDVVRVVLENGKTLKFSSSSFEESD